MRINYLNYLPINSPSVFMDYHAQTDCVKYKQLICGMCHGQNRFHHVNVSLQPLTSSWRFWTKILPVPAQSSFKFPRKYCTLGLYIFQRHSTCSSKWKNHLEIWDAAEQSINFTTTFASSNNTRTIFCQTLYLRRFYPEWVTRVTLLRRSCSLKFLEDCN